MCWKDHNDLNYEDFNQEVNQFISFAKKYYCKLFIKIDREYSPIGSGGFFKYKGKNYLMTNWHVIKGWNKQDIFISVSTDGNAINCLNNKPIGDQDFDIAIFEIFPEYITKFNGKEFLDIEFFQRNPIDYLKLYNTAIVFGNPTCFAESNNEYTEYDLTMFTYFTFTIGVQANLINLSLVYIDQFGNESELIPEVPGLSGSFVYCLDRSSSQAPYKCIGVLSRGSRTAKNLWVINIDDIFNYLENNGV
jgi:hypothetical protein